jgi:hypothetical protein
MQVGFHGFLLQVLVNSSFSAGSNHVCLSKHRIFLKSTTIFAKFFLSCGEIHLNPLYPLVNLQKTKENHYLLIGKPSISMGHGFHSKL